MKASLRVVLTALSLPVFVLAACEHSPVETRIKSSLPSRAVSSATNGYRMGVVDNAAFNASNWSQRASLLQSAGIEWVRLTFYWNEIQPNAPTSTSDNNYNAAVLADLHNVVDLLNASGINVLATLNFSPDWARPGTPSGNVGLPPEVSYYMWWGEFVKDMTLEFPSIAYWGVWNEPNRPTSDVSTYGYLSPSEYNDLLSWAIQPIHAAGDKAVGPELAAIDTRAVDAEGRSAAGYLSQLLRSSYYWADRLDVISVHWYGTATDTYNQIVTYSNSSSTGDPQASRPLWLTESGWPQSTPTAAEQAQHITDIFQQQFAGYPTKWKKTFYYQFTDKTPQDYSIVNGGSSGSLTAESAYTCLQDLAFGYPLHSYCN